MMVDVMIGYNVFWRDTANMRSNREVIFENLFDILISFLYWNKMLFQRQVLLTSWVSASRRGLEGNYILLCPRNFSLVAIL